MPEADIFRISPQLHFPVGRPFEVTDQYNGHRRGTWYFRSIFSGAIHGPFMAFEQAAYHMNQDHDGA